MSQQDAKLCPHASSCPLYPQFRHESLLRIWRANYCEGNYIRCVRFQKSACGEQVPLNLLPNGQILKGATG